MSPAEGNVKRKTARANVLHRARWGRRGARHTALSPLHSARIISPGEVTGRDRGALPNWCSVFSLINWILKEPLFTGEPPR